MNNNVDLSSISKSLPDLLSKVSRYAALLFFIAVAGVYGFILLQINNLSNSEPSDSAVSQLNKAPHIDENVVNQLYRLQDNSADVKTLFDEARNNPFSE
jgi:hypothetical protein